VSVRLSALYMLVHCTQ